MTPSNVSVRASWIKKVREITLIRVELSESVRRIVVKAASGPSTKTMKASCGRYVKKNMLVITTAESPIVGMSFERRGFHNARWLTK